MYLKNGDIVYIRNKDMQCNIGTNMGKMSWENEKRTIRHRGSLYRL